MLIQLLQQMYDSYFSLGAHATKNRRRKKKSDEREKESEKERFQKGKL